MEVLLENLSQFSFDERPTFALNRLPNLLKIGIFQCLSPKDSLKLLNVNQELRHFVLSEGPFHRHLSKVTINSYDPRFSNGQLTVGGLDLILHSDYHRFRFTVSDERYDCESGDCWMLIKSTDSRLFRRLAHCPQLDFFMERSEGETASHDIPVLKFLPRFGGCLREFQLTSTECPGVEGLLEHFPAHIASSFAFVLEGRHGEIPDSRVYRRFFERNLAACDQIFLLDTRIEVSDLFTDPTFPKPMTRKLIIRSLDNDFQKALTHFLKRGLPSRDPRAEMRLETHRPSTHESPFFNISVTELATRLEYLAERIKDPLECEKILEKFDDVSAFRDLLGRHSLQESAYYRKRFSEQLDYFCILIRFPVHVYVFLKSEPIG